MSGEENKVGVVYLKYLEVHPTHQPELPDPVNAPGDQVSQHP